MGQSQKSYWSFSLTAQKTVYSSVLEMAWQYCFAIITNSPQVNSKEGGGRRVFLYLCEPVVGTLSGQGKQTFSYTKPTLLNLQTVKKFKRLIINLSIPTLLGGISIEFRILLPCWSKRWTKEGWALWKEGVKMMRQKYSLYLIKIYL